MGASGVESGENLREQTKNNYLKYHYVTGISRSHLPALRVHKTLQVVPFMIHFLDFGANLLKIFHSPRPPPCWWKFSGKGDELQESGMNAHKLSRQVVLNLKILLFFHCRI